MAPGFASAAADFRALEHRADGGFAPARFGYAGSTEAGWQVSRNEGAHLALGPGYRLLRVRRCGVCATDLARRFLPFPLPQVIGHEVLAEDEAGGRFVVEINASCVARGVAPCSRCREGLGHHCPERRVLGIHDLLGGFGPFVLAPVRAVHAVPDALPDDTATLVEPFAAALHAAGRADWRAGDRVAVLGPRRLGMLLLAALAAERVRRGIDVEIVACVRREGLGPLARAMGADEVLLLEGDAPLPEGFADVVFDTTGTAEGFARALPGARRELHLKSTHGRPAGGLTHLTEAVVDELRFERLRGSEAGLEDAAAVVVRNAAEADAAIRPEPGREEAAVPPCGTIHVDPAAADDDAPLLRHVAGRGLVLGTSRCGDFAAAVACLVAHPRLHELGPRLVTHRFGPEALAEAFATAGTPAALKVVVEHAPS